MICQFVLGRVQLGLGVGLSQQFEYLQNISSFRNDLQKDKNKSHMFNRTQKRMNLTENFFSPSEKIEK
jgi:hypothetical protein